jgi:uncharacterized protein (TIGR02266 family)
LEKRKQNRVGRKIKSEVHYDKGMTFSSSQDISHGGIFISTPQTVDIGSIIELSIYIPESEPIKIKGVVRWTRDEESGDKRAGFGIEFVDANEDELKMIKKIIE